MKRKTTEQYKQECKEMGYDLPIEDYINGHTKIKHRCKNVIISIRKLLLTI